MGIPGIIGTVLMIAVVIFVKFYYNNTKDKVAQKATDATRVEHEANNAQENTTAEHDVKSSQSKIEDILKGNKP